MADFGDPVLPPEICREILARLPVRSVLRCRSVCKSWYFLISCPNFISHHITNLPDKDGHRILLQVEGEHGVGLFSSHDESCMESREHEDDCPDEYIGSDIEIVGSCDGLICVSQYGVHPDLEDISTMTFQIWNPAIRKLVELPPLTYCLDNQALNLIGFGFDSNTSDYKVMCHLRSYETVGNDKCEIIDLNNCVWRSISLPPRLFVGRPEAECYVNGAVHWSLNRFAKGMDRVILSFSMSDESFREIRMPECAEFTQRSDSDRIDTRCVAFGGLLHVIVCKIKLSSYELVVDVSESCSVWAMKEYGVTESWIKVSNIDLQRALVLPSTRFYLRNFILWAKHEILMVHNHPVDDDSRYKGGLVLYNIGSRKSRHILSITKSVYDACRYKESLALLLM